MNTAQAGRSPRCRLPYLQPRAYPRSRRQGFCATEDEGVPSRQEATRTHEGGLTKDAGRKKHPTGVNVLGETELKWGWKIEMQTITKFYQTYSNLSREKSLVN